MTDPTAAIVDLATSQRELAASVDESTKASYLLYRGVKFLVAFVIVGVLFAGAIGVVMVRNTNTLVDLANQNRDNGTITKNNSEDLKRSLSLIESVTGPAAQARQAASTRDILLRNAIETDCRHRRSHAGIPAPETAPPNTKPEELAMFSCTAQTPPDIYPSVPSQSGSD